MSRRKRNSSLDSAVIVAIITLIGAIITAYLNYRGTTKPLEVAASQTAEAIQRALSMTSTSVVTPATASRDWIAIFKLEFPAGYWKDGVHRYLFDADCPFAINSTKDNERPYWFAVKAETNLQDSTVYLRRTGLYLVEFQGTAIEDEINPEQTTAILYGPLAPTFQEAEHLLEECKVRISIDDREFMNLLPDRIDKINN